ncbi:type II and III secretion system protein family protein [Roseomonas sp. NAR14]|uniref:Type II and III secretion system protein family protein n=1 Tax=Roseomonas acroporae TaxID=2937791 RepID=A0A9X1Y961_9PROT|nr:type II and III secretion system protein family protein [Roseomonas acroporae]MCK8785751.1 type II and III secretion system protein family protein [Roseomonas acroporae]
MSSNQPRREAEGAGWRPASGRAALLAAALLHGAAPALAQSTVIAVAPAAPGGGWPAPWGTALPPVGGGALSFGAAFPAPFAGGATQLPPGVLMLSPGATQAPAAPPQAPIAAPTTMAALGTLAGAAPGAVPSTVPLSAPLPSAAPVQRPAVRAAGYVTSLVLEAGRGRLVTLPGAAASLFAADPRVAELRPASPSTVFLFGVASGRTTLAAIDESGRPLAQWEVTVRPSGAALAEAQSALRGAFSGGGLQVTMGGNGVVLTGNVASPAEAERAVALLRTRLADDRVVIDNRLNLTGTAQVNLRVRIAEVSREVTRQLGINWTALGSVGRIGTAGILGGAGPAGLAVATANSLFESTSPSDRFGFGIRTGSEQFRDINAVIDALARDNLITILAEPNLTANTGEAASFLAGGEFPIPVSQRDNQIAIQFKQFGVSLAFVPTVLGEGRISLRVRPEVSELSDTNSVRLLGGNGNAVSVPGLNVRRAETTVELGSGQSFAVAGLLQDSSRHNGRATPWIGEVPVLGALFRSDRYQRNETELVIIVTPYLVRPVGGPDALAAPTDGYVPPSDVERILLLRQIGRGGQPPRGRLPGNVGFVLD